MNDFWDNVSRYPRFFISSLAGLVLIILEPFRNLFKVKEFQIFIPFVLILFVGTLYLVILNMTGF